jgi:hypothetical protein
MKQLRLVASRAKSQKLGNYHMLDNKIHLRYRTWFKGRPPRPIRLTIPGWAGENNSHEDGSEAQPWHCPPFVEGSCYGLELIYPFDNECRVTTHIDGNINFSGDFKGESPWDNDEGSPPFKTFAKQHYGFTSSLDLMPPEGYVTRLEPHPRYYTDTIGDVPLAITGHIQRFWPKIFFVVFKAPWPGQTHIFRKDEPYAQILILPQKISYDIQPMTSEESNERARFDSDLTKGANKYTKNVWRASDGSKFDDKYRQLARLYVKSGEDAVHEFAHKAAVEAAIPRTPPRLIGRRKKKR